MFPKFHNFVLKGNLSFFFLPGFSETRGGFLAVSRVFWGKNLKPVKVSLKPGAEGPRVSMNTSTVFQVFIPKNT